MVARALLSAVSKRIQVVQEQLPAAKAKALLGKSTRCNFCLSCTTFLVVFGFDPICFVRVFLIRIDVWELLEFAMFGTLCFGGSL